MKSFAIFILIIFSSPELRSQFINGQEPANYSIVDEMPKFIGGEEKMMEFIKENTVYPQKAKELGITGKVYVAFIVNKNGEIDSVKVLRGVGSGLDEEAVRVVKLMNGKWIPGRLNGNTVNVRYNIPFHFKLSVPPRPVPDTAKEEVFVIVETMPVFIGGDEAKEKFIKKNLEYPENAKKQKKEGTVHVLFVVDTLGNVKDVKIGRGVGYGMDEEAIRIIKLMSGKWTPGMHNGKKVNVQLSIAIKFRR